MQPVAELLEEGDHRPPHAIGDGHPLISPLFLRGQLRGVSRAKVPPCDFSRLRLPHHFNHKWWGAVVGDSWAKGECLVDHLKENMKVLKKKNYSDYVSHFLEFLMEDPSVDDSMNEFAIQEVGSLNSQYYGFQEDERYPNCFFVYLTR